MTINPKTVYLLVGIWAGLLVGSVIGFKMGSLNSQQIVERIRAEFRSADGGYSTNTVVNMMAALDQARQGARRCGVAITDVIAGSGSSVQLTLTNGTRVLLRWREMGEDTARSRVDLDNKLHRLSVIMAKVASASKPIPLNKVDMSE
jgi:uncharacterized protein YcfJ